MSQQSNYGEREEGQRRLAEQLPATPSPTMSSHTPPFSTPPACVATEDSHLAPNGEFQTYFDSERIHIPESENVRMILLLCLMLICLMNESSSVIWLTWRNCLYLTTLFYIVIHKSWFLKLCYKSTWRNPFSTWLVNLSKFFKKARILHRICKHNSSCVIEFNIFFWITKSYVIDDILDNWWALLQDNLLFLKKVGSQFTVILSLEDI